MLLDNLLLLTFPAYALGECIGGCEEPTLIYDSLKCKPVFASSGDCCPSKYDCSHIEEKTATDNETCLFHGKLYSEGELIDDDEVFGSCRVGCSCSKSSAGEMGFTCAHLDCPRVHNGIKPGCHLKYELDKCCNSEVVCPPFSKTCEVNGKAYHEGQQFDAPDNKCTKCLCQKGFEGKFELPFCKQRKCLDEIGYQTKIKNFCAPSYITMHDCCPFNWICPSTDDNVIHTKHPLKDPNLRCRFGQNTLNIGDLFERTSSRGKLSCECRIPPFLTCIQDYKYPRNPENY